MIHQRRQHLTKEFKQTNHIALDHNSKIIL